LSVLVGRPSSLKPRHARGFLYSLCRAGTDFSEPEIDRFVMAITAGEAMVRLACVRRLELPHVAAELIGWENSDAQNHLVCRCPRFDRDWPPSIGQGIEPLQLMVNAKDLSRAEFVDYTFVFH
jgi:hypothetical protein